VNSMTHITKRQHYLPDSYLTSSSVPAGHLACHDLYKFGLWPHDPRRSVAVTLLR
jgi:hypothetical protein